LDPQTVSSLFAMRSPNPVFSKPCRWPDSNMNVLDLLRNNTFPHLGTAVLLDILVVLRS
jgi:hypothetical protein